MAAATALGKFDITSNLKGSRRDLEREAVESFRELERAEEAFEPGLRFGQAMIDLHQNLKHGEWMDALERLAINHDSIHQPPAKTFFCCSLVQSPGLKHLA